MYIVAKESNEKNKGGKKQVIKFVKKLQEKILMRKNNLKDTLLIIHMLPNKK